jgi:hypothetical protein
MPGMMFRTIAQKRDDEAFLQRVKMRRRQVLVAVAVYVASAGLALVQPLLALLF